MENLASWSQGIVDVILGFCPDRHICMLRDESILMDIFEAGQIKHPDLFHICI